MKIEAPNIIAIIGTTILAGLLIYFIANNYIFSKPSPRDDLFPALKTEDQNINLPVELPLEEESIPIEPSVAEPLITKPLSKTFTSQYFTLTFSLPSDLEVRESQDLISIAKAPYTTYDIGSDNSFFNLSRYSKQVTKADRMDGFRKLLLNKTESTITIDNTVFPTISGDDYGRFEGDSAGRVFVVFFEGSSLEIIERPGNEDQTFDPISVGQRILGTFQFRKSANINGWSTYDNSAFGYEIKYPSNYSLFQGTDQVKGVVIPADQNSAKIIITDKPEMFFCCEPVSLSVEVLNTFISDLGRYIVDNKIITPENESWVLGNDYTTFAGERAYQIQAGCGIDSPGNIIVVNHNDKTYLIKYDDKECLPYTDEIASTFRFTK